jgi:hypothetical protein
MSNPRLERLVRLLRPFVLRKGNSHRPIVCILDPCTLFCRFHPSPEQPFYQLSPIAAPPKIQEGLTPQTDSSISPINAVHLTLRSVQDIEIPTSNPSVGTRFYLPGHGHLFFRCMPAMYCNDAASIATMDCRPYTPSLETAHKCPFSYGIWRVKRRHWRVAAATRES